MKKLTYLLALCSLLVAGCCGNNGLKPNSKAAIDKDAAIEKNVKALLSKMTLREKAGQMMQISFDKMVDYSANDLDIAALDSMLANYKIGSFLNVPFGIAQSCEVNARLLSTIQEHSMQILGIPTIYGEDMIHGATYVQGATFFPQEINLGATFDPRHAANMGEILAYETRAAQCPWVFSPVMDLGRDPRWPRMWESWGEDPCVQTVMAEAETRAIQGNDPNHIDLYHAAVCLKHYMGYGVPFTGKDRTPAIITGHDLREKFFKPFRACAEAGALSVMVNSASINGVPVHSSAELLTGWLKEGLKWDGMIITDWADINNLYLREHVAADRKDALALGINAGIDMIMDPYDPTVVDDIEELVRSGRIAESRINDAAARILRLKYRLGLFDTPVWTATQYDNFASDEFAAKALEAALESEVLLKNDGILPLKQGTRILVTGPNGDNMRTLNGGWSYTWQGSMAEGLTEQYNTIFEALQEKFGKNNVDYVAGVEYDFNGDWQKDNKSDFMRAIAAAYTHDVVVCCIGENTYCETPGNINDLTISSNQAELVQALAKTGKPVVLVLNEGRPRIISHIEPMAKAVVDVMLPSNYGADALALLLSGEENFSGKLPFTYPKYNNSLHTYDYKVSENVSTMEGMYNYDATMDVQWPFGAGLSYTSFEYSDLSCSMSEFTASDVLDIQVKVTNRGKVEGKEAVLVYSSDIVASMVPDVKRLRAFGKVDLAPGESKTVNFSIPASDLAFVGTDGHWRLEEGEFRISAGNQSSIIRCTATKVWKTQNIQAK